MVSAVSIVEVLVYQQLADYEVINRMPENVRVHSGSFFRTSDPVHVSIREAIVNAVIHQDYLAFQPTQFRRFSDRLEIENPGASKKPVREFDRPGSRPRNPLLARAFNLVGLAEQVGSGILTMRRGFRSAGLAEPSFESDDEAQIFRVRFYWHNLATDDEVRKIREFEELSEDDKRAVLLAWRSGRIANKDYREFTGSNIVKASQSLRRLVELGYLERRRGGSATYYVPADRLQVLKSNRLFDDDID